MTVVVNGALAAQSIAPAATYITLGAGKKNPRGRRRRVDGAAGLARALREHGGPDVAHAWWSPHTWTGDSRDKEEQEAACAVALDLDGARHADLTPEIARRLDEAVQGGALPGNIFHLTPAGARLVVMLEGACDDRESYKRAARGVAGAVAAQLRELDIPLSVDPVVAEDLGRILYAPSCAAKGKRRDAEVLVLREEPYTLAALHEWADEYPITEEKAPASREAEPKRDHHTGGDDVLAALQARGLHKRELGGGKHDVTCPWVKEHGGASDAGSAYFEPSRTNGGAGGFKCQHAHCKGRGIGDLRRFLGLAGGSDTRAPTTRLDAAAIFAPLPPVNYLLQALDVAPGAPGLIAGYGYSGKTLAAQDLALAVASGTLVWGAFPVRRGRVLHLDYEQGKYLTCMRYQRLARARRIDPRDLEGRITLVPLPGWYLDSDTNDELTRLCEGVDLLVVDSLRAACPRMDENSSDARIPLDRLTRISEATGVTAVVIHHARKPSKDAQGGAKMAIRGSGAFFDACGSVLVFAAEKGEPITVEHEKARITGRPCSDFRLFIEDVEIDGDPTAGLRVSRLDAVVPPAKQAPHDRFAEVKARVLAFIRDEGPIAGGVNAVCARLSGRKCDIAAAVATLVREGTVDRGGTHHAPTLTLAPAETAQEMGTDDDDE